MKYLTLIIVLGFWFSTTNCQEIVSKSTIHKVTVFTSGAQVNREASVNLKKGRNRVILKGLPKSVNVNTLVVKSTHSKVRSFLFKIDYLKKANNHNQREKDLLNEKSEIENLIEELSVKVEIGKQEEEFITSNRILTKTEALISYEEMNQPRPKGTGYLWAII